MFATEAPTTNGHADVRAIENALRLFRQPGEVVEVRCVDPLKRGRPSAGYFDDLDVAADAVAKWTPRRPGYNVYFTLNPCNPALLARSANRITDGLTTTTTDRDIERRTTLLIDVDPVRPAGISSSDDELYAAGEAVERVQGYLAEMGWPAPVEALSGNGFHLLYRVDEPNDKETNDLIGGVLKALAVKFSDDAVSVDVKVGNASRICKLYGTYSRKGDNLPDRPHRRSEITHVPDPLMPVPREKLEAVAALVQEKPKPKPTNNGSHGDHRLQVDDWLRDRGIEFHRKDESDRTVFVIDCPFDESHRGDGNVTQFATGALGASCFHDSCQGRGWAEFKAAIGKPDAGHFDPPLSSMPKLRIGPEPVDEHADVPDDVLLQAIGVVDPEPREFKAPNMRMEHEEPKTKSFQFYTATEFDGLDLRKAYHVPGILAAGGVPTVMAGAFKTLKTSIVMDLFLSLATGHRFLNHFQVSKQIPVGIMSGESGGWALQNLARRIAIGKGWTLAGIEHHFRICTDVPRFGAAADMDAIERFIDEHGIRVLGFDPTYLALRGLNKDGAGNLFAMGEFLEPVAKIGERTGCTPVVVHHNSRGATRQNFGEPAELDDIAWSGFAEWAGQWLLIARREKYDPDSNGEHRLWLTAGGRDGHSNLVGVNVTEGRADDPTGRVWEVEVEAASATRREAIEVEQSRREAQRLEREQVKADANRQRIVDALLIGPETMRAIRERAGLNTKNFPPLFADLIKDGTAVACEVTKSNGQAYEGYRHRDHRDSLGLHRDSEANPGGGHTVGFPPVRGESLCVPSRCEIPVTDEDAEKSQCASEGT